MYLALHKQWIFGSFLICADDALLARRAYAILVQEGQSEQRTGTLKLCTGEQICWTNCALPYTR